MTTELDKVSFHFSPKKEQCQIMFNYYTAVFISHACKVMLEILQARFQQYVNWKITEIQAVLQRGREPEIKLPTFVGSWTKKETSQVVWYYRLFKDFPKFIVDWYFIISLRILHSLLWFTVKGFGIEALALKLHCLCQSLWLCGSW